MGFHEYISRFHESALSTHNTFRHPHFAKPPPQPPSKWLRSKTRNTKYPSTQRQRVKIFRLVVIQFIRSGRNHLSNRFYRLFPFQTLFMFNCMCCCCCYCCCCCIYFIHVMYLCVAPIFRSWVHLIPSVVWILIRFIPFLFVK